MRDYFTQTMLMQQLRIKISKIYADDHTAKTCLLCSLKIYTVDQHFPTLRLLH